MEFSGIEDSFLYASEIPLSPRGAAFTSRCGSHKRRRTAVPTINCSPDAKAAEEVSSSIKFNNAMTDIDNLDTALLYGTSKSVDHPIDNLSLSSADLQLEIHLCGDSSELQTGHSEDDTASEDTLPEFNSCGLFWNDAGNTSHNSGSTARTKRQREEVSENAEGKLTPTADFLSFDLFVENVASISAAKNFTTRGKNQNSVDDRSDRVIGSTVTKNVTPIDAEK
mmetsp:Transcript_22301/g.31183  ORF Transcript_22301/g.31183 Transcript_22301/m.31183 type:complete len:224 (-) Transcript_22301:158-829(-)|eukprot:CAMPEP_0184490854 /NCGR_PEP_ID=MMETSP0113_2-20130426/19091_1 /TAXON_ID=91329 /ORGANISM="Norrisiella sphaerica, Strain BC52" /LENGTH=223 /DNA_ID=CAMNT_0026874969 /DNA_START=168 /DNA_END=839 /DNA_ORIENTATION=-